MCHQFLLALAHLAVQAAHNIYPCRAPSNNIPKSREEVAAPRRFYWQ
jgi:hypothetical protein